MASKGAKLVLGARREDKLAATVAGITQGGETVYAVTDVTKKADNRNLVELAKDKFGKVDAIFLNAGLMPSSPLSKLMTDDWRQMVDVNLVGALNGIEAVLPEFIAQKQGHVLEHIHKLN